MIPYGNRNYDVTALGELLIDFIEYQDSDQGNPTYEANPGGAPCNLLSMMRKLGKKVSFIGKVGDDMFGIQLKKAVTQQGIDASCLCIDPIIPTTLAFVHKLPDGDRDFSFYRKPGADVNLTEEEIRRERIEDSRIFHFGSLSLTEEPARSATKKAISYAENAGCIRSFDPNLRDPLWDDLNTAREQICWGLNHCDILKISDNEIKWYTGCDNFDESIRWLQQHHPKIRLICLSLGAEGAIAATDLYKVFVPAFINENTVETTGAGDTFGACILGYILDHGFDELKPELLSDMLTFANAAASIVTTRKGALAVMPELEEVEMYIKSRELV